MTGQQQLPLGDSSVWWIRMLNQGQLQCQVAPIAMAFPTMGLWRNFPQRKRKRREFFLKNKNQNRIMLCWHSKWWAWSQLWAVTVGFCLLRSLLLFFLPRLLCPVVTQEGDAEVETKEEGTAIVQVVPSLGENTVFFFGVHEVPGLELKTLCRQVCCVNKCEQATVKVIGSSQHLPLMTCFYSSCSIFTGFVILLPKYWQTERYMPLSPVKTTMYLSKHLCNRNPYNSALCYYFCYG